LGPLEHAVALEGWPVSGTALTQAYAHCEALTREQAANFFYGIRLLPPQRRRAMCAAYAFARRVDDIGDGTLAASEKLALLDGEERALAQLQGGSPPPAEDADPIMRALADAAPRFAIPLDALGELIEGVRMDIEGVSYEDFDQLVLYCRRVAGAIGRVCLAIFGLREGREDEISRAQELADDLGVALQLTNILRDLREDALNGRVYLPAEDLRRFGLIGQSTSAPAEQLLAVIGRSDPTGPTGSSEPDALRLAEMMRFEAARAREWFERGSELTPMLDRRSAACVLAMAGIYRRLLKRIEAAPQQAAQTRTSLSGGEKAWVAVRGMLGVGA
jgi:phytoene synthase